MMRALIIEDEAAARQDLRAKLAAHPQITVVGEAATIRTARALLGEAEYELVFLDVQLIGGNSFDLVPDVRPGARIVFVTAFDHYAVRAFEINALDYLLKPVEPTRLADALRRCPATAPAGEEATGAAGARLRLDDVVYLRAGQRARFALVNDISVISAQDNYSAVQLSDGTGVLVRRSLSAWEETLPTPPFMRVHRTQLVNLARVTAYRRDGAEHTWLTVKGVAEPVVASRYRWSDLQAQLAALHPGG